LIKIWLKFDRYWTGFSEILVQPSVRPQNPLLCRWDLSFVGGSGFCEPHPKFHLFHSASLVSASAVAGTNRLTVTSADRNANFKINAVDEYCFQRKDNYQLVCFSTLPLRFRAATAAVDVPKGNKALDRGPQAAHIQGGGGLEVGARRRTTLVLGARASRRRRLATPR